MARSFLGVDVGSTSIKMAEVSRRGKTSVITNLGYVPLPKGSVFKSKILSETAVVSALKELKKKGFSTKRVVLGVTSPEIVAKTVELPAMPKNELKQAIEIELGDIVRFPFSSIGELCYSFDVVSKTNDSQTVLVIACKREFLAPHLRCLRESGFEPHIADLHSLAIPRIVPTRERLCLIEMGAQQTSIYVEFEGVFKALRMVPIGGLHITEGVIDAFEVNEVDATKLKHTKDIDYLMTNGMGNKSSLRSVIQQFVGGILQTLDFMRAQERVTDIREVFSTIHLCGGTSLLKGFDGILNEELNIPISILDPFDYCKANGIEASEGASIFAGAVGLALRGLDEN